MSVGRKSLRRSARLGILAARWAEYFVRCADGRTAFSDLQSWLTTTLAGNDLPRLCGRSPWLSLPAVRWLEAHIHKSMRVFEWGSGNSTMFFARRTERVVSIEHDQNWFGRMSQELASRRISNVNLHFYPTTISGGPGGGYSDYVRSIRQYDDASFDLILVDGRARCECLRLARKKVRPGGCILLDNAELPKYSGATRLFNQPGWVVRHIEGPVPGNVWPAFVRLTVFTKCEEGCHAPSLVPSDHQSSRAGDA